MSPDISVVIPAYNEAALIRGTVGALLVARRRLAAAHGASCEIIVVDNGSIDGTTEAVEALRRKDTAVRLVRCEAKGAARARNFGASVAVGRTLVFVDADTWIAPDGLSIVHGHALEGRRLAGIARLDQLDGGLRAWCWWTFWGLVRLLPIAKAKAMPALMFCTREAFDRFGPFDEAVAIGEEWPILAGAYRADPANVVYDRRLQGRTSSRRMEKQVLGYTRTFAKWAWAVCALQGRISYDDLIR
ncbi:MAG: glycosyltransferase [Acidobacteria bacterium]|nr:glycosyltransferase [Acidobacteriota bacterium]